MDGNPDSIHISLFYVGQRYQITTFPNEYRSLMHLICDKVFIEDFGECLGMGKCGTCVVKLLKTEGKLLSDFDRNEKETLRKAGIQTPDCRLSCQLIIDQHCDGLELEVPGSPEP